jgi:hypothetical protein
MNAGRGLRKKRFVKLIALIGLLAPMVGHAGTYGDLTYTSDGSSITITDCATTATNVVIPNTLESLPVTIIGRGAFYGCSNLTDIALANGVTSIESFAFSQCASLTNVVLGSTITNVGSQAFKFSENLATISVDPANTYYSSIDGALFNADQTVLEVFPAGKTGSYTVPDSVTNIFDRAFMSSRLTDVTLPSSVIRIGESAFQHGTNLTAITVHSTNPNYMDQEGVLFNRDQTSIIQYPAGQTNSIYTLPNGVANIEKGAFTKSYHLSTVVMPNTVTNIGRYAFELSLIESITIPDSVTDIESYAFLNCTNLISIVMGQGVTDIGTRAFGDCINLVNVSFPNSLTNLDGYTFSGCASLTSIILPSGINSIGALTFFGCTSVTNITIPNSVTSLEQQAFYSCVSLASITIPNSVTSIGNYVFAECTDLTGVYFEGDAPSSSVATSIFQEADNVTVYYLPETSGWGTTFAGRPTVLWNPVMEFVADPSTNGFRFNISGTADIPIAVEACTNLAEGIWVPLESTTLSGGSLDFMDANSTHYPARVYRIATP